jgi:hypothetical protein
MLLITATAPSLSSPDIARTTTAKMQKTTVDIRRELLRMKSKPKDLPAPCSTFENAKSFSTKTLEVQK